MKTANAFVSGALRSPLHRVLSSALILIRYRGRRTGREFTSPTQYVEHGNIVIILVVRPDTKTWWRNFHEVHPIDILLRGSWRPMTARAVIGADQPQAVAPLLDAYLERFPKAAKALGADRDTRARQAVVVAPHAGRP
jgi:hypothetical protein